MSESFGRMRINVWGMQGDGGGVSFSTRERGPFIGVTCLGRSRRGKQADAFVLQGGRA